MMEMDKLFRLLFDRDDPGNGTGGEGGTKAPFEQIQDAEDFEVVVSDDELPEERPEDEAPDISKSELLAKIQEQQAAIEAAKARGDEVAALQAGLKDLGKSLREREVDDRQGQGEPFDEEAYRAKFNEEFYNDPYKFMQDFAMKKIAPEFQRMASRQEELFKREIKFDPERKETYEKYREEIEKEYKQLPAYERFNDPDAFTKAHDRVVARHLDEIIEHRVREALEAQQLAQGTGAGPREKGTKASFNEPGGSYGASVNAPAQGPKKVRLTSAEARWASGKGLTTRKAYEVLQRRPELRKVING